MPLRPTSALRLRHSSSCLPSWHHALLLSPPYLRHQIHGRTGDLPYTLFADPSPSLLSWIPHSQKLRAHAPLPFPHSGVPVRISARTCVHVRMGGQGHPRVPEGACGQHPTKHLTRLRVSPMFHTSCVCLLDPCQASHVSCLMYPVSRLRDNISSPVL